MKHIYLINHDSPASLYGIGTYTQQIKDALKDAPMKWTVLSLNTQIKEVKKEKKEGVCYIKIPLNIHGSLEKTIIRYYKYVCFLLSTYIDAAEDNIFHFNFLHHKNFADILKKQFPDCQIVVTIHYLSWLMELKGNLKKLRTIQQKTEMNLEERDIMSTFQQDKEFLQTADKVICLSAYTQLLLQEELLIAPDKISLIPNGLNDDIHHLTEEECKDIKKKYFFQKSDRIILYVGRIHALKGVPELIEAFKLVINQIPEAKLMIVGDGDYDTCLQKSNYAWNRITFTGKIPKETLYELYQIADIGVIPSFNEQCSYVAIEMMMCGLPFIGTTTTGLKEMLNDKEDWLITLQENEQDVILPIKKLAEKMIACLSSTSNKCIYDIYQTHYSLERMKEKMIKFYEEL